MEPQNEQSPALDFYTLLVEHAPALIATHHADGSFMYASPGCSSLLGYAPDELAGHSIFEFIHPGDRERVSQEFAKVARARSTPVITYRMRHKDGMYLWIETTCKAVQNRVGGSSNNVLTYSRDVSKIKHTELALETMARGGDALSSDDFFRPLVGHIALALQVSYAFVTETDAAHTRVRMLAFWKGQDYAAPLEYALDETPCDGVINEAKTCYYPISVQARFPKDQDLVDLKAQGYLGIPIFDIDGVVIGHLAILDSKPLVLNEPSLSLLKIFAARAGVEIERQRRKISAATLALNSTQP